MADLRDAIAELRRVTPENDPWQRGDLGGGGSPVDDHIATILNAVVSGDLIPKSDAELAVAEAIKRAADEAYDWFYDPEHDRVTDPRLGDAILALVPADALAEVQRLRDDLQKKDEEILDLRTRVEAAEAEKARLGRQLNAARYGQPDFSWALHKEAMLELQADRDAALARVEKLRGARRDQMEARVEAVLRRNFVAPEDAAVEALCLRFGYGAVMDAASRLWARTDMLGAFYIGGCIGFRAEEEALAALAEDARDG